MQLHAWIEINAPPEVVFEVLSTPERLPQWNASVAQARRVADAPVGPGSRAVMAGKVFGQTLESETEVVGYDPPTWFATRGVRGPRINTSFRLEPLPAGTRVSVDVDGDVPGGKLGGFVAERMLRTDLHRSLEQLRTLCEAEARRTQTADGSA